jgi:preprotein translocase subunit SecY
MADNLKKQGSYVPGIRPGEQTKKYITNAMTAKKIEPTKVKR